MLAPLGKRVEVKIGAWNVRTMGVKGKLENVKREMVRNGLNVLGVSEVRWKGNGDFESDDFRVIYSGGEERQRGVAIILDRDTARRVMSVDQTSDRLVVVKIQGEPIDIVLIQIYMPTTNHDDEEVEAMYEKVEEIMRKQKRTDYIVVMGDMNAVNGDGSEV